MKVRTLGKNSLRAVDLNRRKAIRERCLNCSGWFPSEVIDCTFSDCPLFPYRTGKGNQNAKARSKAIRKYCLWCCAGRSSEVGKCTAYSCPLFIFRKGVLDYSAKKAVSTEKDHIEPIFDPKKDSGMESSIEEGHIVSSCWQAQGW